jgi:probable rRNA maturation factor
MTRQVLTAVMMRVELEVQRQTTSQSVPSDEQFLCWIKAALAGKTDQWTMAIRIVDEIEAQRFNRDYRNRDYATNVLSFAAELPENLPAEIRQSQLGDLLMCAPVVAREAIQQQRSETDHWAHLTVHGILHLLGYDHEQAHEAGIMESMETEILSKLGVSDPYQGIG